MTDSEDFSRRIAFTAADLQDVEFPELVFVVDQMLAPGSTILAGKPKVNKSWLALEIALAVSGGELACGAFQAFQGDVLYFACEDNARRLKSRLRKLLPGKRWPDRLTFKMRANQIGFGFLQEVEAWAAGCERPSLVILDTYHFVRPARPKLTYAGDYEDSSALTGIANDLDVSILAIHHQRKSSGDDALDTISGSTGVAAGFDSILVLERDPNGGFVLEGRGRDLPDYRHALDFDAEVCRWGFAGDADTARLGDLRRRLLDLLDSGVYGPTQAANALGENIENVRKTLQRMRADGQIQKNARGQYAGLSTMCL